jgi:cation transport ATPase
LLPATNCCFARVSGSLNLEGPLTLRVTAPASESQYSKIVELVRTAQASKLVGGINRAARQGIIFRNGTALEDAVVLTDDPTLVGEAIAISRRTLRLARQSIVAGLGLSVAAMVFAAFGYIPPILGALLQEGIDVVVILNALRASFPPNPPMVQPKIGQASQS